MYVFRILSSLLAFEKCQQFECRKAEERTSSRLICNTGFHQLGGARALERVDRVEGNTECVHVGSQSSLVAGKHHSVLNGASYLLSR